MIKTWWKKIEQKSEKEKPEKKEKKKKRKKVTDKSKENVQSNNEWKEAKQILNSVNKNVYIRGMKKDKLLRIKKNPT